MNRLDKYIPVAIDVIEDVILRDNSKIIPEWESYVTRFGIAMRQMGMIAAVTAFSSVEQVKTKKMKRDLMHCLLRIILVADNKACADGELLLPYVQRQSNQKFVQHQLTDAAIAFKLGIRLFIEKNETDTPSVKKEGQDNEGDQKTQ